MCGRWEVSKLYYFVGHFCFLHLFYIFPYTWNILCRAIDRTRTYMFQLWKKLHIKIQKQSTTDSAVQSVQFALMPHDCSDPSPGRVSKKRWTALYAVLVQMQHINTFFNHSVRFLRGRFEQYSPKMFLDFLRWYFEQNTLKSNINSVSRPTLTGLCSLVKRNTVIGYCWLVRHGMV